MTLGDKIYTLGAFQEDKHLWSYDPTAGSWDTSLPDLHVSRGFCELVAAGGRLYAIGGHTAADGPVTSVESWAPGESSWRAEPSMKVARSGLGSAVIGSDIYVFGGGGSSGYLASTERLSTKVKGRRSTPFTDEFDYSWPSDSMLPSAEDKWTKVNADVRGKSKPWRHGDGSETYLNPENVWTEDGRLVLLVPGNTREGGQVDTTRKDFSHGSYRASLKASSVPGVVNAFFFYADDKNEIDVEILTEDTSVVHFVCHGPEEAHLTHALGFDPTADYHEYGFDWYVDKVVFYVDGNPVNDGQEGRPAPMTVNLPKRRGHIMLNNWPGMEGWGGAEPPAADALMYVERVEYVPFE